MVEGKKEIQKFLAMILGFPFPFLFVLVFSVLYQCRARLHLTLYTNLVREYSWTPRENTQGSTTVNHVLNVYPFDHWTWIRLVLVLGTRQVLNVRRVLRTQYCNHTPREVEILHHTGHQGPGRRTAYCIDIIRISQEGIVKSRVLYSSSIIYIVWCSCCCSCGTTPVRAFQTSRSLSP